MLYDLMAWVIRGHQGSSGVIQAGKQDGQRDSGSGAQVNAEKIDSENISVVPVITIDGPSGSGKGVITERLAKVTGFHILDSGALYRLVGYAARLDHIELHQEQALASLAAELEVTFSPNPEPDQPLCISLREQDVTWEIRTDQAGVDASIIARLASVRRALGELQIGFRKPPGLIADGRDMGTVVFPTADLKIFLTASASARAERRYKQLKDKDIDVSLAALLKSIQERDARDTERAIAPLKPAADAIVIDSTLLSIDAVVEQVTTLLKKGIGAGVFQQK